MLYKGRNGALINPTMMKLARDSYVTEGSATGIDLQALTSYVPKVLIIPKTRRDVAPATRLPLVDLIQASAN